MSPLQESSRVILESLVFCCPLTILISEPHAERWHNRARKQSDIPGQL